MFLKPSLSDISIIYTLPFKKTVWIAYIVLVTIMTVALYISQRFEHYVDPTKPSVLFADAALNSIALICQEGEYCMTHLIKLQDIYFKNSILNNVVHIKNFSLAFFWF